jgi:hypothetical protein
MVDEQIASGSLDKTETIGSRWLMKMQRRESLYVLYGTTYEAILSQKKNSLLSSMDLSWMHLNLEVKRH